MNKAKELKTTTDIVKEVLKAHEQARNCDDYLYFLVCTIIGKQKGYDVENMNLAQFLLNRNEYKLPSYDTVGRARRKLQGKYKELRANDVVEHFRSDNEKVFRRYARGIV